MRRDALRDGKFCGYFFEYEGRKSDYYHPKISSHKNKLILSRQPLPCLLNNYVPALRDRVVDASPYVTDAPPLCVSRSNRPQDSHLKLCTTAGGAGGLGSMRSSRLGVRHW